MKEGERECEEGGSNTRVILSVQKPRPRFNVRVQTGRGEQPLGVWRIGVVHRVYSRVVTGSMIPYERINFFLHLSIHTIQTQVHFLTKRERERERNINWNI